jgi:hypothetical protein
MRFFTQFTLSGKPRPFAKPVLSQAMRFFASLGVTGEGLRVTVSKGFRMTNMAFPLKTIERLEGDLIEKGNKNTLLRLPHLS